MYHQFVKRDPGSAKAKGSHQGTYSYGSRSRSAYSKRQSARTHPTQGKRSSSAARSEDSEISLRSVIEKTMEVHIYPVNERTGSDPAVSDEARLVKCSIPVYLTNLNKFKQCLSRTWA